MSESMRNLFVNSMDTTGGQFAAVRNHLCLCKSVWGWNILWCCAGRLAEFIAINFESVGYNTPHWHGKCCRACLKGYCTPNQN